MVQKSTFPCVRPEYHRKYFSPSERTIELEDLVNQNILFLPLTLGHCLYFGLDRCKPRPDPAAYNTQNTNSIVLFFHRVLSLARVQSLARSRGAYNYRHP